MARRANITTFGGLNPFGGGGTSFGSFSVGGSSGGGGSDTVDPSKQAALEFQKVQTEWQAGRMSDAEYQSAYQSYVGSIDTGTATYYNAMASFESFQYTAQRDAIQTDIASGAATWSDLVAFDQASLAGLNPGSTEYRDRLGRLFTSQGYEFSEAEQAMNDDLQAGRITYTQALGWYEGMKGYYQGNAGLLESIDRSINTAKSRVLAEQDQTILDDWKAGKIGLDQLLAYSAKIQAEDPNTERGRTWAENSRVATTQAVESSLQYRYSLTEEYRELALLVASTEAPKGRTSISKSIQYYVDADGNMKSRTVTSGRYIAPTAAQQQAYAERKQKAEAAKKRMAQIEQMVGGLPGGWVVEDDIIRNLQTQQAGMVKGSPAWIEAQGRIDYYNDRKATDELLRKQGVKINLPTAASERAVNPSVGASEKAVAASAGGVKLPTPKATTSGGGGGGTSGGGGGKVTLPPGAATAPKGGFLREMLGPAKDNGKGQMVTTLETPGGGTKKVAWKATGLPAYMSDTELKTFVKGMSDAIKDGATTWIDSKTGVGYVLPPDPTDRLAMLEGVNQANVAMAALKVKSNPTKTNINAYNKAVTAQNSDFLYVLDDKMPGIPAGMPREIVDSYLAADRNAAPIGASLAYKEEVETNLAFLGQSAKEALDRGDYEAAWTYLRAAQNATESETMHKAEWWAQQGEKAYEIGLARGGKPAETGKLASNRAEMLEIGNKPEVAAPTDFSKLAGGTWLSDLANKTGLEEVAAAFTSKSLPFVRDAKGQPIPGKDGNFQLKEGYTWTIEHSASGDKIGYAQLPTRVDALTNRVESADPTKIMVSLQVGATFKDVLVPWHVETIGRIVQANGAMEPITGKVVDVEFNGVHYRMAQDPTNPERWVPLQAKGTGLQFTLGANAQVVKGAGKFGTTGTQIIFTVGATPGTGQLGGKPGGRGTAPVPGQRYLLAQEDDGTYSVWQVDKEGNVQGKAYLGGDPQALKIMQGAGINLDIGALTNDQRNYLGTRLGGVYLGDPARISQVAAQARNTLYGPSMLNLAGSVGNLVNLLVSNLKPMFTTPKTAVTPPMYRIVTPGGGVRTVVTSSGAARGTVGPALLEGGPVSTPAIPSGTGIATYGLTAKVSTPKLAPTTIKPATGTPTAARISTPAPRTPAAPTIKPATGTPTAAKISVPTPKITPPPTVKTPPKTTAPQQRI